MRAHPSSTAERGFVLVIVLWAGVLLAVIAASFAFSMRVETRLAGNLVERAKAQAIADAGIHRGILALLSDTQGPRWIADGRSYELSFGDGRMRVRLQSENGKVDLNGAPEALIQGLLNSLSEAGDLEDAGQAEGIAAAILDWRDPDHRMRPGGAEDRHYRAGGEAFGARDGAFLSVAELNQVLGVEPPVYQRLASLVTVYSWAPQVDPMTASRDVLRAIPGLDASAIDTFVAARESLYAFEDAGGEGGDAPPRLPLELLSPGARYLSRADSRVYTVDAEGEIGNGARASRRAVVQLTGDTRRPFAILAWFDSIPDPQIQSRAP
jgi:general secretion pathway protein K